MVVKKKKRARHVSIDEDFDRIFKRFNTYEERIDRLKELERQLNSLDIRGFESEASLIKSKIRDPVAVYEVEKEINTLRNKIKERIQNRDRLEKIKKIDPKISGLIDIKYHNFISAVKERLSKDELKNERIFRKKLDKEFRERINKRIEDLKQHKRGIYRKLFAQFNIKSLKKEKELQKRVYNEFLLNVREYEKAHRMKVSSDYNSKLKREINKEKELLEKKYKSRVENLKRGFSKKERDFEIKEKRLFENSQKSRKNFLLTIEKKRKSLENRKEFLRKKSRELRRNVELSNREIRKLRENLENETKQIHDSENLLERKKLILQKKLEKKKKEFENKIRKEKERLRKRFSKLVREVENRFEKERVRFRREVEGSYIKKFNKEIEEEKKALRYKVRKNLSRKMEEYIDSLLK